MATMTRYDMISTQMTMTMTMTMTGGCDTICAKMTIYRRHLARNLMAPGFSHWFTFLSHCNRHHRHHCHLCLQHRHHRHHHRHQHHHHHHLRCHCPHLHYHYDHLQRLRHHYHYPDTVNIFKVFARQICVWLCLCFYLCSCSRLICRSGSWLGSLAFSFSF